MRMAAVAAVLLCAARAGAAEEDELRERVGRLEGRVIELEDELAVRADYDQLEDRVRELEGGWTRGSDSSPDWARRIRLSGNADFMYLNGQQNSRAPDSRYSVDNARFFVDVATGFDSSLNGRTLAKATGFHFEWDLIRHGRLQNDLGSMYAHLDGLLGADSLNLRFGRQAIPFGEEYPRFSEDRPQNPFLTFSVPAPYDWDEGVVLWGALGEGRFQYTVSAMDGDAGFNENSSSEPQLAARVVLAPTPWAHLTLSALRTGELGSAGEPGESAMGFAGTHATPVGNGTAVPTYQDGAVVPTDPSDRLDTMQAFEADLVFSRPDLGRVWLGIGRVGVRSGGSSSYDRDLSYWIAEGVYELSNVAALLNRFYLAARFSEFGTFDADEGYFLARGNGGAPLGFNGRRVSALDLGLGFRLSDAVNLKGQYSLYDYDVVDGVDPSIAALAHQHDFFGVGLSLGF